MLINEIVEKNFTIQKLERFLKQVLTLKGLLDHYGLKEFRTILPNGSNEELKTVATHIAAMLTSAYNDRNDWTELLHNTKLQDEAYDSNGSVMLSTLAKAIKYK